MTSDQRTRYHGGCLCGAVRYRVTGPLRDVVACHCSQCRKTSGHYVAATQAAFADLVIEGDVTWYQSSDTGRRGFCGICGGQLFWQGADRSRISIFAGTLDGETGLRMAVQLYPEDKGDYYDVPDVPVVKQGTFTPVEGSGF